MESALQRMTPAEMMLRQIAVVIKSARTEEKAPTPEIAVAVVKPENVKRLVLIDLVM